MDAAPQRYVLPPWLHLHEGPVLGARTGEGWGLLEAGPRWLCPRWVCNSAFRVTSPSCPLARAAGVQPWPSKNAGGKDKSKGEAETSHTLT